MIPVGRDDILSCFSGIPAVKLFINYILTPCRDLSFVLPESHFLGVPFFHLIASAHQGGTRKLINPSVWRKSIYYPRKFLFLRIFTKHITLFCEKESIFIKFHKENVYKSKQIPCLKLSRFAKMKVNFLM